MPTYEFNFPTLEDSIPMGPEEHYIDLPVNKEIADALEVDKQAEVTFNGRVAEISAGFSPDDTYSIRVAVKRIEVYPDNEFTELSKDDDD